MSDYISEVDQIRAQALAESTTEIDSKLSQYHFRSGLALDMLSALACEAVADIYGRHRGDPKAAAMMLRWMADRLQYDEANPSNDLD